MRYGLIFSAGKETRFDDDKPKSLSTINGKCLLDHNIEVLEHFCNSTLVVCSTNNQHYFEGYDKIVIDSGKGCGDAVFQALQKFYFFPNDSCIILWGDCVSQESICKRMVEFYNNKEVVIPCFYENEPYVRLSYRQIPNKSINVEFGKYGEVSGPGFHDFGIFLAPCRYLLYYLDDFATKIKGKNGEYSHKHGNEMQFLDLFNETDIYGELLEIQDVKPLSFNTKEELYELNNE